MSGTKWETMETSHKVISDLQAELRTLRAENEARVTQLLRQTQMDADAIKAWQVHCDGLTAENAELRADKESIDWLEDRTEGVSWNAVSWIYYDRSVEIVNAEPGAKWPGCGRTYATAREAMTAALATEAKESAN